MYAGFCNTLRLMRITQVFLRHDLGEFVTALGLYRGVRFLLFPGVLYRQPTDKPRRGQRLRRALEELGPVFVKFGQMLSTRPDLIPDDIVSRIRLHNDPSVSKLSENIWGPIRRSSSEELQTRMDRLAKVILSGKGDPYAGKPRFVERCAKCHSLFGVGERVGPDLTSYQRSDLPNMLLAVVNPDAEIREGYENHLVVTDDGRTLTGILVDQDLQTIVIRGADGQVFTMSRESIDAMEVMKASMMPTGVLRDLTDVQIRDLFAYLRSSQPLND